MSCSIVTLKNTVIKMLLSKNAEVGCCWLCEKLERKLTCCQMLNPMSKIMFFN